MGDQKLAAQRTASDRTIFFKKNFFGRQTNKELYLDSLLTHKVFYLACQWTDSYSSPLAKLTLFKTVKWIQRLLFPARRIYIAVYAVSGGDFLKFETNQQKSSSLKSII